jgi:hypothetical protein
VCQYNSHAWVIRVGTLNSNETAGKVEHVYDSIQSFANYCASSITIAAGVSNGYASFNVLDAEEGNIAIDVALNA